MAIKFQKEIYLDVKDYSVSGEIFQLHFNKELHLLETYPQPSLEKLPGYYQSEDYISHTGSQRNLFERAYHFIKSITLKRKLRLINAGTKDGYRLLDVGCGTGDFLQMAIQNGWKATGVEPNEQARLIANNKSNNSVFDVHELNKLDAHSFNVITLWHVLEHLPETEKHITLFKKLLKPNGTLIIAVPNFLSFDANYYKHFWAAYDVPRHLWHFSQNAISKLVLKEEMEVTRTLPMIFDAFYVCLLSEKYKTGKMNPLKSIWIGLLSNFKAMRSGEYSSLIYIVKNIQK